MKGEGSFKRSVLQQKSTEQADSKVPWTCKCDLQTLLFLNLQTSLAPAICSKLAKPGVEDAFAAHNNRPLSLHRKYVAI